MTKTTSSAYGIIKWEWRIGKRAMHSESPWHIHRSSQVPWLCAFVHYASHLTEVNSGSGLQKRTVTKRPLELLGVLSKAQYGGLRFNEYCGGEAEDTKVWKILKKKDEDLRMQEKKLPKMNLRNTWLFTSRLHLITTWQKPLLIPGGQRVNVYSILPGWMAGWKWFKHTSQPVKLRPATEWD